jgi:ubiquinone biosynthesis protein UbiJ
MVEAAAASATDGGQRKLPPPPVAPALNHLLRRASWARERLAAHAGKTVCFDVPPLSVSLEILATGEVAASSADATTTFRLTPALALRIAATGRDAWRDVETSGDLSLARDVLYLAENLRWDAEEDLSRVFGDILAHRIAGAGNALLRWQQDSARSLLQQAAAYWTEERPLIAARPLLEQFARDVDMLRDDVARFEKRLDLLAARR